MRIGPARYRWEFQLLAGETANDFDTLDRLRPLIKPWTSTVPIGELTLLRVAEYTFRAQIADRWRQAPSSSSATRLTSLPRSSARAWERDCETPPISRGRSREFTTAPWRKRSRNL